MQYDQIAWVEIGLDADNHVSPTNVLNFAERIVSPDGDMVYPMQFINDLSPVGVHHNHKLWEVELTLDTDWLLDKDFPLQFWAYYEPVHQILAVDQFTVECADENSSIDWFRAYIREGDASQTRLIYTDADTDHMWCVNEVSDFSNEPGARRQTTTWRFLCFEDRGKTHNVAGTWPAPALGDERPVRFMRIDNVTIAGNICTNVHRFRDEYRMQMTPQFIPNTFEGLDLKQDQKWRVLTIVVDSETDIFDTYFGVQAANGLIPVTLSATFTLADAAGTQRTWTYSGGDPATSYILNRRKGDTHADVPRDTIEYQILTTCDKAVS